MSEVTLLNMCMIYHPAANKVVVLDKIGSKWDGLTFPGGHVENGESIVESVIREMREETGLVVRNLRPCGLIHWYHTVTRERRIVFLYKTNDFIGQLIKGTREGRVFWMNIDDMRASGALSPGMEEYFPLFLEEGVNEAFATWDGEGWSEFLIL